MTKIYEINIEEVSFIKKLLIKMQNLTIGDALKILDNLSINKFDLHIAIKNILNSDMEGNLRSFLEELSDRLR